MHTSGILLQYDSIDSKNLVTQYEYGSAIFSVVVYEFQDFNNKSFQNF